MIFTDEECLKIGRFVESLLAERSVRVWMVEHANGTRNAYLAEPVDATHVAFMFGERPIERKRETAEDVLADIVAHEDKIASDIYGKPNSEYGELIERARRVLEAK